MDVQTAKADSGGPKAHGGPRRSTEDDLQHLVAVLHDIEKKSLPAHVRELLGVVMETINVEDWMLDYNNSSWPDKVKSWPSEHQVLFMDVLKGVLFAQTGRTYVS